MKRFTVFVVLVLGLLLGSPTAGAPQQVTLLHVNDTHSHLAAWGPKDANLDGTLGGLPKAAAIVAAEKAADPHALFVHAGDFMNGDLFMNEYLGVPELQLLKSIGLDALILGNRDFQFGPDLLASVLSAAWSAGGGVPILGTNLNPMGHALGSWITPTLIKEVNGVKVGFFGLTHPSGALAKPAPVKILAYLTPVPPNPYAIAPKAVSDLRAGGAQVVVCMTHFGMDRSRELAQNVGGIDVIVNAHDNAVLEQPEAIARPGGGTTFIVSAGNYYRWVGRLRLSVDGDQVSVVDYALLGADAETPALPAVQATIETLKAGIVARYGDVYHTTLGWAGQDITPDWDPEKPKRDTALGNLVTDAYRAWTGTDIAIEASGYLGDALPRGAIVGADVFRAMSYGAPAMVSGTQIVRPWRLTTFRATGGALTGMIEKALALGGNYFLQFSGLRMDYDSRLDAGHRILLDRVRVGENTLEADQLYSVTTTEGVFKVVTAALGLPVQDVVPLSDQAFDTIRALVALHGDVAPRGSNRIRDIAAIPGKGR